MKRFKTFWILSISQVLILLLYLGIQTLFVHKAFSKFYSQEKGKTLFAEANLISHLILPIINNPSRLQQEVVQLSIVTDSRVTVVLPSGIVVADSLEKLDKLDNHKNRPEILAALNGKNGLSQRFSDTLNQSTINSAIPLFNQNKLVGVLRLSKAINSLKNSLEEIFNRFFLGSLIITIVLIILIAFYTKNLNLSLEKMSLISDNFLKGKYFEKIKIGPWDSLEISSLGKSLNKMGGKIEEQINKIIKQQKELEAVFSSMSEGVLTLYPDKKIYQINNSAKRIFNLDKEKDYRGFSLGETIRIKKIEDFFDEVFYLKSPLKAEFELKEGNFHQVSGTILTGENNQIYGALLVLNDISNLRKLEQHRKEFVANVSHELRTPLTSINGYLENLMEGSVNSPEDQLRFLKVIQKQSMRLQKIIEDLLTLSQVESEENFTGEYMNIAPILYSAKSHFKENILIECQENIRAKIIPHLLEIAITNLLQNAVRYGKKNEPISLSARVNDQLVEIAVSDKGIGIESKHHHRLFERFYSVDKSRSREFGGSGLGLSIVKHIAMAHNGSVGVRSDLNQGSTFYIFLPNKIK